MLACFGFLVFDLVGVVSLWFVLVAYRVLVLFGVLTWWFRCFSLWLVWLAYLLAMG